MENPTIELLARRRSAKPQMLGLPAPSAEELERLLTIAARVPDHKKLVPWRFVVFEGEARAQIGEVFAAACLAEEKETPSPARLDTERSDGVVEAAERRTLGAGERADRRAVRERDDVVREVRHRVVDRAFEALVHVAGQEAAEESGEPALLEPDHVSLDERETDDVRSVVRPARGRQYV